MKNHALRRDKYFLRDLHHEIDFYDRKLAYLDKYMEFASPADRDEAEKVLLSRRSPLEKTALELVASGVEYEEKDLPRSFRTMNLEHKGGKEISPKLSVLRAPATTLNAP